MRAAKTMLQIAEALFLKHSNGPLRAEPYLDFAQVGTGININIVHIGTAVVPGTDRFEAPGSLPRFARFNKKGKSKKQVYFRTPFEPFTGTLHTSYCTRESSSWPSL